MAHSNLSKTKMKQISDSSSIAATVNLNVVVLLISFNSAFYFPSVLHLLDFLWSCRADFEEGWGSAKIIVFKCVCGGGEDGGLPVSMKTDANSSTVRAFFKVDHPSGETRKKSGLAENGPPVYL